MDFRNDTIEIRYEPDGSILMTTQYKDFKRHGKSRTYLDKKLWLEVDFVNDVKACHMTDCESGLPYERSGFVRQSHFHPYLPWHLHLLHAWQVRLHTKHD